MIRILTGTNRPGSNARKVARLIEGMYRDAGVPVEAIDLALLPLDVFLPSAYGEKPAGFAPFSEAVLRSDGLHVVTPEYNGGMPGVLKYFIDLLKFPESFERRPVCFTGVAAGAWGALRPVEQLQAIFGYRNAYLYPERVFLPRVHEALDEAGQLKDPELAGRLRAQASGFAEFVGRFQSPLPRSAA